jgi:CRP-like cAMP-binding protein
MAQSRGPTTFASGGIANRLLLSLPEASLKRLEPALELRVTARGNAIKSADRPVEHYYFVNRGLISLVKTMKDGRSVEIGVIGIEGFTSPHTLFGLNKAATDAMVQIPGDAFRIRRDDLIRFMGEDVFLRNTLEKYAHFAVSAIAQTATCNRLHLLEARCSRWLLVSHDSARSDTFELTHEFLAMMLGVQRSGVSVAANLLQKSGLIRYVHGKITITDRAGLEEAACECYAAMQKEYDDLIRAPHNN